MRILIFGLPGSGKTTLAQELVKNLPCFYLNADKVRETFGDNDFSIQGRINQAKRMKALADMARDVLVIADFVCPTEETRRIFKADLLIWMNTVDHCKYADTNKIFEIPKKVDYKIISKDAKKHSVEIVKKIKGIGR